ncbi:cytochrome c [Shinella granuli]|jgi:mono/diheme cytochrome c family protein|uniref:Mono/diheme cytochrome c family protein n=1 Tax=Shinella granuli TaxID=323621 RepID=A0A4R2C863_SHIGR|nr:MAG: alcohol dehydrogenase [Bradyrhizobiaceae bacterium PARB1]TCN35945.1 mono/diheme cytochrome c family protein [Shinella granuli]
MERVVKLLLKLAFAGVCGLGLSYAIAISTPYWFKPKTEASVDSTDATLIRQGEYLAHAGDCIACHTAPGGKPFAGGLGMQTPMGTIYSTNITPEKDTGIGGYSYGDFERAVRKGVRPDGTHLYPAMPYVSYAVVRDDDIKALYAYFMSSVPAVRQDNQPTTMPWPLSMRWPLAYWQLAFAQPRHFTTTVTDAQLERGAYLVEGLAHCGACHTPRGIAFQETALADGANSRFLSGSVLEGWYAKNLRGEDTGLSTWTTAEIVDFLKTGRNDKTAAFGSMSDVVEHSTQHLSNEDLTAIATYLKSLKARDGRSPTWQPKEDITTAALKAGDYSAPGATSYVEHCAICHRMDGKGAPRIYPALAGNSMVFADDPSSLIQVTLAGGRMPKTPHDTMAFTMPGFASLTNREVADVLNFIRNGWGNHGSEISEADISRMRHEIERKPKHYVPGEQK